MAKPERRIFYLIARRAFDHLSSHDVLDMLRYDAARVECNPPQGFYLLSAPAGVGAPSDARWDSFGVKVLNSEMGAGREAPYRLTEWARLHRLEYDK